MPEHDNKVAIVTGGAQGIGYAVAERLAREGARVVIADINDEVGHNAAEALSEYGPAHYVHCNVANRLDIHNLIASTLEEFGDIDILVNNAGIVHSADFLELSEEDFDRVLSVNLKGVFLASQAVALHMVEKAKRGNVAGTIINISSVNSVFAIADQVPYSVSKGGLNQLTKVSALALVEHGIRVNAVGPGSVITPMLEEIHEDQAGKDQMLSRTPMGRAGDPDEVAAIVSFLASNDASYMTGQTIYADGGRLGLNYTVGLPEEE